MPYLSALEMSHYKALYKSTDIFYQWLTQVKLKPAVWSGMWYACLLKCSKSRDVTWHFMICLTFAVCSFDHISRQYGAATTDVRGLGTADHPVTDTSHRRAHIRHHDVPGDRLRGLGGTAGDGLHPAAG